MITILLLACSPGTLKGAAAKGPYILGSSVSVSAVDDEGDPTGAAWNTETSNDLGTFSLDGVDGGPVRIEVTGYHFDEVRGVLSSSALTLRATGEVGSSETIYVNTVTHLVNQRVLRLMEDGASVEDATASADGELMAALALSPDGFDPGASGVELTLLDGDSDAGAWLLAVSAVFVQAAVDEAASEAEVDATLQELLNHVASDLADDGTIEARRATVIRNAMQVVSSEAVSANLAARFETLGFGGEVPDLRRALDRDEDGTSDAEDDDADGDGELNVGAGGNDCYDEDNRVLGCGPSGEATLDQVSAQTLSGDPSDEDFGAPLSALGDPDADGKVDFAVGTSAGIRFYQAGDAETPAVQVATVREAWAYCQPVGDTDGDGQGEVSLGQWVWDDTQGRVLITPYPPTSDDGDELEGSWLYGLSEDDRVTGAWGLGDIGGDGLDDVAVVVVNDDSTCEWCDAVRIFEGPLAEEPDLDAEVALIQTDGDAANFDLKSQRDLDGDGLGDLVVSDLNYDSGDAWAGGVFFFQSGLSGVMTPADADAALIGGRANRYVSRLGSGDFDGDGHVDFALSPLSTADATEADPWVAIFRGPFSDTRAMVEAEGKLILASFVSMEVNSGTDGLDADGDGVDDLWVGARFEHTGTDVGRAYLIHEPLDGARDFAEADASLVGTSEAQYLGQRLSAPGDLDGDGRGDLLVWSQPHAVGQVDVVLGGGW